MISDNTSPTGAAPARDPSGRDLSGEYTSTETFVAPPPADTDLTASTPESLLQILPVPPIEPSIPADLRVPWGWSDIGLLVIFAIVAGLVINQTLIWGAISIFGVSPNDFSETSASTVKSILLLVSQTLVDGFAIVYLFVMLRARTFHPFWREIGWRKLRLGSNNFGASAWQCLAGGGTLGLVVAFFSSFLNPPTKLPIEQILQSRISVGLFAIMGVLVAPLVEETVFRGFLYPVIARQWGIAVGVVATGVLFGALHAAQLWGGWGQIALLILVGIALTWARARTGTVAGSYFVHLGYNGIQVLGFLVSVLGAARR